MILATLLAFVHVPSNLGYASVFLFIALESMGVPSPGETALALGAIAAAAGHLDIALVIAFAALGAIVGDNLGFLIGRHGGRRLFERPGFMYERRQRLLRAGDAFFARHGARAVFLGRWVLLVRVTTAWMAGGSGMSFGTFFFWNALGGITWAIVVGLIAYSIGEAGVHVLTEVGIGAAIFGVLLVLGIGVWLRRREGSRIE